jgi:alpha-tubulin suppressor-like RCC1 family protein
MKVPVSGTVHEVAAGRDHVLALTREGNLYCWGSNDSGELGLRKKSSQICHPKLNRLKNVVEIACGLYHSAAITKEGKLYTFGAGQLALGLGDQPRVLTPHPVKLPGKAKKIACGGYHNFVTLQDGSMVCWGTNNNGQLGFSKISRSAFGTPTCFTLPGEDEVKKIIFVGCGYNFTQMMDEDGVYYYFGAKTPVEVTATGRTTSFKLVFPKDFQEQAWDLLKWVFLGRTEKKSCLYGLPDEILFQMVFEVVHKLFSEFIA